MDVPHMQGRETEAELIEEEELLQIKKYLGRMLKPHHISNFVSMLSGAATRLWQNRSTLFMSRGSAVISARYG